ncbi:hypothetical protein BN59_01067 [Legionella massiliensis]|uniref:Uncharacterized protein n=1 Tax=Legionella massiliensis TaxID=1034943 RepID=A0A078KUR6_9GAMM|nr:hypothetical protein [Legionella massiliensis]CDZ76791.1 hypothetical protein BN59_01067 [Legionella massiliensis]CEE12529.1 hypothetical protein BN1094_01067 [Legionella massiliensis]
MNKKIALLVLGLSTSTCFAAVSLEGKYNCHGTEIVSNTSFGCEMLIKKTGETYASTASCDDGNAYQGNAVYDEKKQILATGFINPKKAEETGVAISYVKEDGSLQTDWTYINETTIGHSLCIKKK